VAGSNPNARDLVAHVPLFAGLAPAELGRLAALTRRRRYRAGDTVFHEGDAGTALYLVQEGEVKIVLTSAEGKEVVVALLGRGDVFGEFALLDGAPRSADAVTTVASDLLSIERTEFLRFLTEQPQVAVSLLAELSRRLRRTDRMVHDAAFLDVRTRLVRVLLDLADTRGQAGPRGVTIASQLTQTDLATMAGTTRESVNRWLRYYVEQGLLRYDRRRLTVVDPERLRAELT